MGHNLIRLYFGSVRRLKETFLLLYTTVVVYFIFTFKSEVKFSIGSIRRHSLITNDCDGMRFCFLLLSCQSLFILTFAYHHGEVSFTFRNQGGCRCSLVSLFSYFSRFCVLFDFLAAGSWMLVFVFIITFFWFLVTVSLSSYDCKICWCFYRRCCANFASRLRQLQNFWVFSIIFNVVLCFNILYYCL